MIDSCVIRHRSLPTHTYDASILIRSILAELHTHNAEGVGQDSDL